MISLFVLPSVPTVTHGSSERGEGAPTFVIKERNCHTMTPAFAQYFRLGTEWKEVP